MNTNPSASSDPSTSARARVDAHYRGDAGKDYFDGRLDGAMDIGRRYQSRHFAPYCAPGLSVLDMGCGDGTILRHLPAARKVGVELNPLCHERIAHCNHDQSVPVSVHAQLSDLPATDLFDVVISNHMLEHVPAPLNVLTEINGRLTQDGILVLVVPFDDWRDPRHRQWVAHNQDNHLHTWTPMNLGNLVTAAGFEVIEAQAVFSAWTPRLFWVQRLLGNVAFDCVNRLHGHIRRRCEVRCVARLKRPPEEERVS